MCIGLWRFALTAYRFYRRYPGRKHVQIETKIKSPKRYDELRGSNPAILLQGNLFTPESAGPRELAMLCFRIVNMGYADSSIMLRYVQCAIQMLKKLRIKHVALVMQSVSKYIATSPAVLVATSDTDDTSFKIELINREKLLIKFTELVELVSPHMFRLFSRAVPKDLGMVALSMVTVCECAHKELDVAQHSNLLKATESTLKQIAELIGPKLPFCEIQEYAALAKAFCKIPPNVEYADMFLSDLTNEISCLLNEKHEYLTQLVNGIFIDDDLLDDMQNLPRELTTIACTLSRRVKHHRMWQRLTKCIELMLVLGNRDSELFSTLDGQTLVLLATSLSRHADVTFILEAIVANPDKSLKPQLIVTAITLSLRVLDDVPLAQRIWDVLDFSKVPALADATKIQLLHASIRIPCITEDQRAVLRSLYTTASTPDLLVALYSARHKCKLDVDTHMIDTLMQNIDKIGINSLIALLRSADEQAGLKGSLLKCLQDRLDEIHIDKHYALVIYIIDKFGGHTELIEAMVLRLAQVTPSHQYHILAPLVEKLQGIGFDPCRVFSKDIISLVQNNQNLGSETEAADYFVEGGNTEEQVHEFKLCESDEGEIEKLSHALRAHSALGISTDRTKPTV